MPILLQSRLLSVARFTLGIAVTFAVFASVPVVAGADDGAAGKRGSIELPAPRAVLEKERVLIAVSEIEDSKVKLGHVIALINRLPPIVWEALIDIDGYKDFFSDILDSCLVSKQGASLLMKVKSNDIYELEGVYQGFTTTPRSGWDPSIELWKKFAYVYVEFPQVIGNRWGLFELEYDQEDIARNHYILRAKMVHGTFARAAFSWEIIPYGDGKSSVLIYKRLLDPGVDELPPFYRTALEDVVLPDTISTLKRRIDLHEAEYTNRVNDLREIATPKDKQGQGAVPEGVTTMPSTATDTSDSAGGEAAQGAEGQ